MGAPRLERDREVRPADYDETLEIVVYPHHDWLIPSPAYVSLEVDRDTFDQILAAAQRDPEARATACSELELRSAVYRRFSVIDPSGTRVELLTS